MGKFFLKKFLFLTFTPLFCLIFPHKVAQSTDVTWSCGSRKNEKRKVVEL